MSETGRADFVWRFRIDEKPRAPVYDDPLLEWIRVQWEELLRLCVPYAGNEALRIDGFALMRDLEHVRPIFPDDERFPDDSA